MPKTVKISTLLIKKHGNNFSQTVNVYNASASYRFGLKPPYTNARIDVD